MQITNIEQVLNLAETLNTVLANAEGKNNFDITIHGIENENDLKLLAAQERGNFFEFDNYKCCSVRLGKINFIITSKN